MKKYLSIVLLTVVSSCYGQLDKVMPYAQNIEQEDLKKLLYVYASDYFQGRESGELGQKRAVTFLREFYQQHGIAPADGTEDYFQKMTLDVKGKQIATENVVAIIPGKSKPNEYVVISSHLDHEGIKNGKIYNGADDDGSGTIAQLRIAQAFQQAANEGNAPERSVVFLHFTGEEKGLLGSKYYADNPLYPIEQTVVDLNIDMIGRIDPTHKGKDERYIYIIGSSHLSSDLHELSERVNKKTLNLSLDYKYNEIDEPECIYYRSDHYNFAKNNIPVIFYFNGVHEDYHKPTDTPEKIEYELYTERTQLIFYTAWELANGKRIKVDKSLENISLVNCKRYINR